MTTILCCRRWPLHTRYGWGREDASYATGRAAQPYRAAVGNVLTLTSGEPFKI